MNLADGFLRPGTRGGHVNEEELSTKVGGGRYVDGTSLGRREKQHPQLVSRARARNFWFRGFLPGKPGRWTDSSAPTDNYGTSTSYIEYVAVFTSC